LTFAQNQSHTGYTKKKITPSRNKANKGPILIYNYKDKKIHTTLPYFGGN